MTTTAHTDRHRYLLALLGPRKLAELSPITAEEADLLESWFAQHPDVDPMEELVLDALEPDGSVGDPDAFAVLADTDQLGAYLEQATR